MNRNKRIRKTEMLLNEWSTARETLDYLHKLCGDDGCESSAAPVLSGRQLDAARRKIAYLTRLSAAITHSLERLSEREREVIVGLYFDKSRDFWDVCIDMGLERSSIYRYRRSALEKISEVIF